MYAYVYVYVYVYHTFLILYIPHMYIYIDYIYIHLYIYIYAPSIYIYTICIPYIFTIYIYISIFISISISISIYNIYIYIYMYPYIPLLRSDIRPTWNYVPCGNQSWLAGKTHDTWRFIAGNRIKLNGGFFQQAAFDDTRGYNKSWTYVDDITPVDMTPSWWIWFC